MKIYNEKITSALLLLILIPTLLLSGCQTPVTVDSDFNVGTTNSDGDSIEFIKSKKLIWKDMELSIQHRIEKSYLKV